MRESSLLLALCIACPMMAGIPRDKKAHIAAGAVIGISSGYLAHKMGAKHPQAWGFAIGVSAGIAKELYDRKHPQKHSPEFNDALATTAGASVSFAIRW